MEAIKVVENPAEWLETAIKNFVNTSPENTLQNRDNDEAWTDPLVEFSSGDDPLYQGFKENIGAFYWTPWELFTKTFPGVQVEPDQLTVISWILPQVEATKFDNRKQTLYPSESWVIARIYGEEVNVKLRQYVGTTLKELGFTAVAPCFHLSGSRKHLSGTGLPPPGPNDMQPLPQGWELLVSVMV